MRRLPAAAAALLFLLAACSPEAESPAPNASREAGAAPAPVAAAAEAEPRAPSASAEAGANKAADASKGSRRCGWLVNPTPANWWLTDRDGQWILSTQGAEQAPGMDEMPDMSTAGWVETNGHYGYGCACMTIAHDPASGDVTRISAAEPKPLEQCRSDRKLPKPE